MTSSCSPWQEIPLADYETHMQHSTVGQIALLNALTKKYADSIKPAVAIFLGVAGGNGLEHINTNITKQVIGIDINQSYLDATAARYGNNIAGLQLLNLNITENTGTIGKANFVWAALIIEYTGIESCLLFAKNNLLPGGHFVATIQANNGLKTVSSTGVETIKKAGPVFKVIGPDELLTKATEFGFTLNNKEENMLPNGKSLITFDFVM